LLKKNKESGKQPSKTLLSLDRLDQSRE